MFIRNLLLSSLLLAVASACKSAPVKCLRNGTIQGVSILVDPTGLEKQWKSVHSFVKLFKNYIDHTFPVSVFLTVYFDCAQAQSCPLMDVHLKDSWTSAKFDEEVDNLFAKYPTIPALPLYRLAYAADLWKSEKKNKGLPSNARTLTVLITNGEVQDEGNLKLAEDIFTKEDLKLIVVHQKTSENYGCELYEKFLDNPEKDIVSLEGDGNELNEDLLKQLLRLAGCH